MTTSISPASGAAPRQTPRETPHHAVYRPGTSALVLAITAAALVTASEIAQAVLIFPASRQLIETDHTGRENFSPDYVFAYAMVAILGFGLGVAAYVVTGLWLWRARGNAEFLAPDHPHSHRRGWVWGAWLVPVVLWWFPFQVVRDIATTTRDTAAATWDTSGAGQPDQAERPDPQDRPWRAGRPSSRVLGWWWGAWLAYGVTSYVVGWLVPWFDSPNASAARALVWLEVLNAGICLVALLFWVKVLRGIGHSQEVRAAQLRPVEVIPVPAGLRRASAGVVWALIVVPACVAALFVFYAGAFAVGVYEVTTEPVPARAAHGGTGAASAASGESTDVADLEKGDCIANELPEGNVPDTVVVDCETRHVHEVFAVFDLPAGPYPGKRAVAAAAEKGCTIRFRDFVGIRYGRSYLDLGMLYPLGREGWADSRGVTCLVSGPAKSTGTYQGSRR